MFHATKDSFLPRALCSALFVGLFAAMPAAAQNSAAAQPVRPAVNTETAPRITVEASGAATALPDMAELQISVRQDAKTAKEAAAQVKQTLTPLLAALERFVPEKDIQSIGFEVSPVYPQDGGAKNSGKRERSFSASAALSLKIRDTDKLGAVIDAALANGATNIDNLSWTNSNAKQLYAQARQAAVAEALEKTAAYAHAAGGAPGRVLKIEETGSEAAPRFFARAAAPLAADMPAAPGENSYQARVSVTTELINQTQ